MELAHLQVTQWRLRNPRQVPALIEAVGAGAALPPVLLAELEDGTVYIHDGHHRCLAYLLSGRIRLGWGEFILLQVEHARAIRGFLCDPAVVRRLRGEEAASAEEVGGIQRA